MTNLRCLRTLLTDLARLVHGSRHAAKRLEAAGSAAEAHPLTTARLLLAAHELVQGAEALAEELARLAEAAEAPDPAPAG
jgi:hypothetical protein